MLRVIEHPGGRAATSRAPSTLTQLREMGDCVAIHGQHEHQSLLRAGAQRELLDVYGGLADAARNVAELHRVWQQRRDNRRAFETNAAAFAAEREQLDWQVRELAALKVAAGEWQDLTEQHTRLAHAASLIEAAQLGIDSLSEGDGSSLAQLNGVIARLKVSPDTIPDCGEVSSSWSRQSRREAVHSLLHYGERIDLDPQRMREVESRLEAIHGAARNIALAPADWRPACRREARLYELAAADADACALEGCPRRCALRARATAGQ